MNNSSGEKKIIYENINNTKKKPNRFDEIKIYLNIFSKGEFGKM